jgi:hypothetical protein
VSTIWYYNAQKRWQKNLLAFFVDEVTTIDIKSWISIHGYVFEIWQRMFLLLNLERIINDVIFLKHLQSDVEHFVDSNWAYKS